jgi:DNA-binding SARP family transcriptional activator
VQRVEFRVLGPFEVLVEGRALELKRRKQRALLALLLLHAGEVVSTDRLIDELWAGKPPKAAVGSLQNLISDLRKALGRDLVRTRQPGYVLDVEREQVDLHRFERLVAQASEPGNGERRSELLREALALWRGPPLADLAFEPFAQVEIARLEELRTAAREELVDASLELGRHAQLVGELEALVAEHPLRERLRGQLMLALYRSGRQAEALDAYRHARETLVEELGIEPSTELQQLEQAVLRHDQELDLPARATAAAPEPERRKTVTMLFTNVVQSTALGAALDPEVMRAVMSRYFDLVRMIVERHGGTVEKFIGDAAMAAFGVPQQHEDDAMRAVRAATELRQAITGLNADLEREHGVAIQIRTAINTGEVVAGDSASGQPFATGSAINVAIKLHEAALPAEILLGPTTHGLVRETAATEPVEPVELGGSLGRIPVHRLVFVSDRAGLRPPGHAAFVGRGDELNRLRSAFEEARAESRSRVLTILGEAGVGKSRLVRELASSLGDEARFVVGRCLSYGEGATYLPLAEIVQQVGPKRPHASIASLLARSEDAELVAARLTELTGEGDGGGSSGEVFWAVRRLFDALAREQPLVVVLEDVHWAEPTLLDLVEYLAAWTVEAPLLIVCLARPELRDERPGLGAEADVLTLDPLEEAAADTLVGELGGMDLDDATRKRIVAIAEGNPLFLEQLLAFLEEVGPDALDRVPPTVEALLASRIDRLEAEERSLLECAAVVGRRFPRAAVLHLTPPDELPAVDGRLRSLARRGLISALRDTASGFRFHHVLIRDVAYAGVTKEARGVLHERLAAWLEGREEHADEIIGYHLEQAHRYRAELRAGDPELPSLAERGGERLAAAGIRAWRRADAPAAVNLFGRATVLLPPGPSRSECLCELASALRTSGQIEEAEAALRQAIEDSKGRDRRLELRARIELAQIGLLVDPEGQSAALLELTEDAIPLFEELGDDRSLGRTLLRVAYVRGGVFGDNKAREEAAERALLHYRRSGWSPATCLGELGAALYYGPTPVPEATRRCAELLEDAVSDLASEANIVVFLGGLEAMRGRFDLARELVAKARTTFEEIGLTTAVANFCGTVGGMVEMTSGDYARAEAILRESCLELEEMHEYALLSTRAAELAEALFVLERSDEAVQWLSVSARHAASDDADAHSARLATEAEVKAGTGDLAEAEQLSREAVRLAAATDMLNRQGRTLLVLADVLRLRGRFREAVAPIEQAARAFSRKGSVVLERKARAFLDELVVS